jgi:hypothetical protein
MVFADLVLILETIATVAALVSLIGLGITTFVWVRKWRRRLAEEPDTEESIETYRNMLDEGILEAEEFDRIARRLRETSDAPAEPSSPESPSQPLP